MELYTGRPASDAGREEKEIAVYDLLDSLGIEFQRTDHAAAMTMEDCFEADKILGIDICKNLFLCNRQKTKFYLLLIPGKKPFKTKELTKQIPTSRLSFGTSEDMERLLNVTPGSATIMGLMFDTENQVQLLVDEDVLKQDEFGCHPCVNTSSLKMKTKDIFEKYLEAVHHNYISVKLGCWEEA